MTGPVNTRIVSQPFSNFVQLNPEKGKLNVIDLGINNSSALKNLYLSKQGELKQSSNAISHFFRSVFSSKPVNLDALQQAIAVQVGDREAERLLGNLRNPRGNLKSLNDINEAITGRKYATWESKLEVEDMAPDDLQMRTWQNFQKAERSGQVKDGERLPFVEWEDPDMGDAINRMFDQNVSDEKVFMKPLASNIIQDIVMRGISSSPRMNEFSDASRILETGATGYANFQDEVKSKNPVMGHVLREFENLQKASTRQEWVTLIAPGGGMIDKAIEFAKAYRNDPANKVG
jgi:hypothetical protein